ncbi:MAG TPA: quinate 5-dehydrogenase [Bacillota bacterium]|nr:quinate 5-dehydrogenase [Bacillota bacterium]
MKRVVSVSLGSPRRDYEVEVKVPGSRLSIRRVGTGGDLGRAAALLKSLDGEVDAIGLGGVNLYFRAGRRLYRLRDGARLAACVEKTPLVDGSGIKDTVESGLVDYLHERLGWPGRRQTVLLVSALDRYGLAAALEQAGCRLIIGDAVFALGLPLPFYSLSAFRLAAYAALPALSRFPINRLYPLGEKQETAKPAFGRLFREASIIAGDFHFLRYRLPADLSGKDVITSTVTSEDVKHLKERGIRWLVTTGPSFNGRSFGANVLEAVCVALLGGGAGNTDPALYPGLFRAMKWEPRVEKLN